MKIKLLIVSILFLSLNSQAQISILNADMPRANDTLRFSNAINNFLPITFEGTGANFNWNFSNMGIQNQEVQRYYAPTATPYFLQFFSASYGVPEGNLNLGPVGGGTASNAFSFYRATNQSLVLVGRGATIQNLPLGIVYTSRDTLYKFPLQFGDTLEGNYIGEASFQALGTLKQVGTRTSIVDGWGTITTPYGTFNCLRVKSTIIGSDSIIFGGFGIPIPNDRTEYTWLAKGERFPVLEVIVNNLTNQITSIRFKDRYRPEAYVNNANFNSNRAVAAVGDTITLTSTSLGNPTSYNWQITPNKFSFVAGTNASSASPRLVFSDTGNYSVRLSVGYLGGSDDTLKVDYIRIRTGARAAFSISTNHPKLNEIVSLTDQSTGDVLTWQWSFIPNTGIVYLNGTSNVSQNPVVQFNQPGTFAVQLRVTNLTGPNTLRKDAYVHVWPTGEKELSNEPHLSFFPNPAFNIMHINSNRSEPIQLRIIDMLGQTVFTKTLINEGDKEISIESFSRGIYFVDLVQGDKRSCERLLLK
ncbi:MAG: PKD domain-containing protein [Bacteroidia bacterium]|nr:PKD domain-containing protein [Bacteroidia bacterium]